MGADVLYNRVGGGKRTDLWEILQSRRTGSTPLQILDVGGEPPALLGHWGVPPQGGKPSDWGATSEADRWNMGVPPVEEATRDVSLEEVDTYITWRQNMVAQYIETYPIL